MRETPCCESYRKISTTRKSEVKNKHLVDTNDKLNFESEKPTSFEDILIREDFLI